MLSSCHPSLSYDDHSIMSQLTDKHQITQRNTRLLIKYYTHFVKTLQIQTLTPSLRKSLAEIALIFTQKSNFYLTVEGSQKPGICFSMNDILKRKSYSEIANLLALARQVVRNVKFRETSIKVETLSLLTQIQKGLQEAILFQKLCWVFMKNTLQNSSEIQSYKQTLINFSWYLYIDVKSNCLPKDCSFPKSKVLMVSVLQTIILRSLSHLSPLILQKNSPKSFSTNPTHQKRQNMTAILQILLKQGQITQSQIIDYQKVNHTFNAYFDHLVLTGVIKSFSQQIFDFLCPRSLEVNLRKIDRKISKEIESSQIDLRRLISYELTIEKDHKKTAIEDKLIVKCKRQEKTKQVNAEPSKKYKSHRVLNLDNCEAEMASSSTITQSQITFPSNLFGSTTRISLPGIQMRTNNDQLRNFLIQKIRNYIGDVASYEASILNYIESGFKIIGEKSKSFAGRRVNYPAKRQTILQAYEFYAWLADQIWPISRALNRQYILQDSESAHECLLIIAIGTVLLSEDENDSINPFFKLIMHFKPSMMDFFYTLICVTEFDLPIKLKNSLAQIMETLINQLMWNDIAFIEEINAVTQHYAQIHEQNTGKLALTCILEKVSEYLSDKIKLISSNLSRAYSPQTLNHIDLWTQKSIQLALIFTIYCPQLLHLRTIDQLILCSLYGMSKFLKLSVRFHDLIQAYHQTVITKPSQFEITILKVKSSFCSELTDLIGFYNSQFIAYLNYAFEILADKEKLALVFQLSGDSCDINQNMSPFGHPQQAIILSPRPKKNQQTQNFRQIQRYINDKENYEHNSGHSISINLDQEGQLGILSFMSGKSQKSITSQKRQGKIEINLQINQGSSRNPTRVKERKMIEEKQSELCATHKGKHPIFAQLRKIDEE